MSAPLSPWRKISSALRCINAESPCASCTHARTHARARAQTTLAMPAKLNFRSAGSHGYICYPSTQPATSSCAVPSCAPPLQPARLHHVDTKLHISRQGSALSAPTGVLTSSKIEISKERETARHGPRGEELATAWVPGILPPPHRSDTPEIRRNLLERYGDPTEMMRMPKQRIAPAYERAPLGSSPVIFTSRHRRRGPENSNRVTWAPPARSTAAFSPGSCFWPAD